MFTRTQLWKPLEKALTHEASVYFICSFIQNINEQNQHGEKLQREGGVCTSHVQFQPNTNISTCRRTTGKNSKDKKKKNV